MQFRWVAIITLYTFLIGPVFDHPGLSSNRPQQTRAAARTASQVLPTVHP
jgi:hypothetical protein